MGGDFGATSGRIIVLDGTTSSGKSTLAAGLRARFEAIGDCWIITGIDDYLSKLPPSWFAEGDRVGPYAEDGCVFDTSGDGFEMRMGPVGRTLMRAYRESVGAMARTGMNVIVDDVLLREDEWESWQHASAGLDVTWVRVRIDLDVLEARETVRGDRALGMARWQYELVHRFPTYDVEVDTGVLDPVAAADAVFAATR